MLPIITFLLLLAALFSVINERYLRLQATIGLMLLALVFALIITVLPQFGFEHLHNAVKLIIVKIDFSQVVLQGMLCFLLFAGAMNISFKVLADSKWDVITLAVVGTIVAVVTIGSLTWLVLIALGIPIPYLYALIFGAIISPTDPIAALSILESIGLPKKLEVIIDGESQFNDGVGVVLFVALTGVVLGHEQRSHHFPTIYYGSVHI